MFQKELGSLQGCVAQGCRSGCDRGKLQPQNNVIEGRFDSRAGAMGVNLVTTCGPDFQMKEKMEPPPKQRQAWAREGMLFSSCDREVCHNADGVEMWHWHRSPVIDSVAKNSFDSAFAT